MIAHSLSPVSPILKKLSQLFAAKLVRRNFCCFAKRDMASLFKYTTVAMSRALLCLRDRFTRLATTLKPCITENQVPIKSLIRLILLNKFQAPVLAWQLLLKRHHLDRRRQGWLRRISASSQIFSLNFKFATGSLVLLTAGTRLSLERDEKVQMTM